MTLVAGTKVLFNAPGPWVPGTLVAPAADGTWRVHLDEEEEGSIFGNWDGVVLADIIVDDEGAWSDLCRVHAPQGTLGWREAKAILEAAGRPTPDDEAIGFFCDRHLDDPASERVDVAEAYRRFRAVGLVATRIADATAGRAKPSSWYRLYWNEVRMGGRPPEEVGRAIGIDDAAHALGLSARRDAAVDAALADVEARLSVTLPAELRDLMGRAEAADRVKACHCNTPGLAAPSSWEVQHEVSVWGRDFAHALRVMLPHQGPHAWWACFNDGDAAAVICIGDDGPAALVAPSFAFFLWDLAQTGQAWRRWQEP